MGIDPLRPAPARRVADHLLALMRYLGAVRLVGGVVAIVLIVAAAVWLLRAPHPPVEASLPFASPVTAPPHLGDAVVLAPITDAFIVVHVAGAVASPGLVTLDATARVADAIDAAGGLAVDADAGGLNLALRLADGQRVYVPRRGEPVPAEIRPGGEPGTMAPTGPVDLNRATSSELERLPGVGPATAQAIISHRERAGPFRTVDDLVDVRGIGPAKLEALRDLVTV